VETSVFVISSIPDRPSARPRQKSPALLPNAETTPIPVMTTLFTFIFDLLRGWIFFYGGVDVSGLSGLLFFERLHRFGVDVDALVFGLEQG
jgi:hypothetical protein